MLETKKKEERKVQKAEENAGKEDDLEEESRAPEGQEYRDVEKGTRRRNEENIQENVRK